MLRSKRSLTARQREMRNRNLPACGPGWPTLAIDGGKGESLATISFTLEEIAVQLRCSPNTTFGRGGAP